ncbi:PAB-dependent poly(A)-specific ribonuclease subunit PAN2 [Neolecta irregularis DAH-3]|uniref:PAB-dependent poly(A)-specific ribonuclease subunit PAN2 n=1 Tax=Neolecta irregularis (strain DAH-3) TaxID=1198029 RepID=A0A1U7LWB6_NEOID|nr:PAB-dependent poly(A)-specific ribonuclease subunit PAN2 [Neolecta irregularis DAH-3]|eukprot:OLL26919.1 PAB-dependent poly(A)-specific ribonuclease subunit PAN2 [Neolecta irregularis DAH-3]
MTHRRGIPKWTIEYESKHAELILSEKIEGLQAIIQVPLSPANFLAGGYKKKLYFINAERGQVVDEFEIDVPVTVMRSSRSIYCGTAQGGVVFLDPKSFKLTHSIKASTYSIADMDAQGNYLITSGWEFRNHSIFYDHFISVFDIRTMKQLPPIPFLSGAIFVRIHPKVSTAALATTFNGQIHALSMINPEDVKYYTMAPSTYLQAMSLSPTGEAIALGEQSGTLQLWGNNDKPRFSQFPAPTEWPDVVPIEKTISINSDEPLNSIGMPYYREELLSSWPTHMIFEVGKPSLKVDPDILASVHKPENAKQHVWAHNPRRTRRYQAQKSEVVFAPIPRFRSGVNKYDTDGEALDLLDEEKVGMARYYKRVEIKYSKFGVEDFDFGYYNKTPFSGLETDIANSYCNSLLQVYHFITPLRKLAIHHAMSPCHEENCLFCELGFLSNNLLDARGANCQATNFLRTFRSLPQAAAMGLLIDEVGLRVNGPRNWLAVIQIFNRFMLDQIYSVTKNEISPLNPRNLMGSQVSTFSKCHCGHETDRTMDYFVFELNYPSRPPNIRHDPSPPGFATVIKNSIQRDGQAKAWCTPCHRYQIVHYRKQIYNLPPVLTFNANVRSSDHLSLYATKDWLPTRIGLSLKNARMNCVGPKELAKKGGKDRYYGYELTGIVVEIEPDKSDSHLISIVKVPEDELPLGASSPWYMFNDFLVRNIPEEEALTFAAWKVPAVFAYQRIDFDVEMSVNPMKRFHDLQVILTELRDSNNICTPLQPFETITKGIVVAIDSEFVSLEKEEIELHSSGKRNMIKPSRMSLARVSVIRGFGENEGTPFIDDYIATTEHIIDYLTDFSGIRPGDLTPGISAHPLISRKEAYRKLRLLVNLGCVFVGHGLKSDFRTMNINIPKEQVIDTVDLFFIQQRQRKLSLRFLAWFLLHSNIQTESHDSVEDAKTALLLYKKYLEYKDAGVLESMLMTIYEAGKKNNFRPPEVGKTEEVSGS